MLTLPMVPAWSRSWNDTGAIDKFMGDALMALFGAPVAHERDPEWAVWAALDMRGSLAEFNRTQGLNLAIHIGLNTEHVLAGSVGSAARQDYSVVGDAVNVASQAVRMLAGASPDWTAAWLRYRRTTIGTT
jgi:adenylate cyclase